MEVTGRIKLIGSVEQISDKFKKRDLVVTTEEQYPQHISMQFVNDKCDVLNSYKVGDKVTVNINLRGREWVSPQGETKYFNTIPGWKIEKWVEDNIQTAEAPQAQVSEEENDDLAF